MNKSNGDWPSGKAPVFGTGIRGFESLIPSQKERTSMNSSERLLLWGSFLVVWFLIWRITELLPECTDSL